MSHQVVSMQVPLSACKRNKVVDGLGGIRQDAEAFAWRR
jgi:hypothetical protein